jgi:phage gpG-like protein
MQVTLQVQSTDAFDQIAKRLQEAKGAVQQKMASVFREAVWSNFGGAERFVVAPYAPLSPSYARKVGRSYATLEVSGKLKGAIYTGISDEDAATVSVEGIDYAASHQFGNKNMPRRPFFPLTEDGEVLSEVEEIVTQAARDEMFKILSE